MDILVKRYNDSVITDIYYKPTDTKQYLDFHSNHTRHIKRNVPYNLARRICTIVIDNELRNERLNELRACLLKRHYPAAVINYGIEKANSLSVQILRTPKAKVEKDMITFVTTHNPNNTNMYDVFSKCKEIMNLSPRLQNAFKEIEIINSKRQSPNLKRLLTKASFSVTDSRGSQKCNDSRCKCCKNIIETSLFHFEKINKIFEIRSKMTCDSQNLIYVLLCKSCSLYYVGQTNDKLRNRARVHRQQILNPNIMNLKVSKHIHHCTKDTEGEKFKILPIYKLPKQNVDLRLLMENHFIDMLQPDLNADSVQ